MRTLQPSFEGASFGLNSVVYLQKVDPCVQVHQVEAKCEHSEEMGGKKEEREDKATERKRCPTRLRGIKRRNQG